jgi:hypothetical protein
VTCDEDEAFAVRLAQHVADDVHWMMQRVGPISPTSPAELIADTRYTRILRKAAEYWLRKLEDEADDANHR